MRNQGCVNGTLDEANYSSPMPVVGSYAAAATLVCLLLMLLDILTGFLNRKRWIPCRFFPLNSVTLTLVAIATKLPVDLTTPMPSAQDQLSKLTGSMLVCIYIGFVMPSLALTRKSECLSNMVSLTIFVITIFVNICIQMRTGVIFMFRVEHITVLCCMILLLVAIWILAPVAHTQKEFSTEDIKEDFTKGSGSLLRRLEVCYLQSYNSNPQLRLCKKLTSPGSSVICIICAVILVGVTVPSIVSKELGFFRGTSDYKWSMWTIVVSQVITILVGCLATTFRLLTMAEHAEREYFFLACQVFDIEDSSWFPNSFVTTLLSPAIVIFLLVECLSAVIVVLVSTLMMSICSKERESNDRDGTEEFEELVREGDMGMDNWTLKRGVKDMKRWTDSVNKIKTSNHLSELLSKTPPSDQDSLATLLQCQSDPTNQRYKISSLLLVALAKVATTRISSTIGRSLSNSLDEVLDVIHYIDKKVNSSRFMGKRKYEASKAMWAGKDFVTFSIKPKHEASESPLQLDQALENIRCLKQILKQEKKYVKKEVTTIMNFIEHKSYSSIEELCSNVQQLFVDVCNDFLIQLPTVVFKDITESPPEDLEERVRFALKIVNKFEQLEALVQWSFPVGTNITNLIAGEVAATTHVSRTSSESNSIATDARQELEIVQVQSVVRDRVV